ncbi:RDD family protein [uncultured Ferrimonas sp.]|uniref:RDD family protein n=1 Tax=uncultured Ferrimonas sp. TaxID=432640 RepID=UPI0026131578|nr:RDD family protein [uncultured Ferrimonas sp.]
MYCSHCGQQAQPQTNFCRQCGQALTEPTPAQPQPVAQAEPASSPEPTATAAPQNYHPWRRLFARTVDLLLIALLILMCLVVVLALIAPVFTDDLVNLMQNELLAGVMLYLMWLPIEAMFVALFGATPGKWIFGIKVRHQSGRNLSYPEAFKRSGGVLLQGEGAGIPLLTLFTRIYSYFRLKKSGSTPWDDQNNSAVSHCHWGAARAICACTSVLVTLLFVALLSAL